MAVMDEFKEERARMKTQPFKVKLAHYWHYYKLHVIAIGFVLFFVGSYIYNIITTKDIVLQVGLIDCYANSETPEEYTTKFEEILGIDTKKEKVYLDNSYYISDKTDITSTEILLVRLSAQELDVMLADEDTFDAYARNDIFVDLRDFLTPEQLAYYEDSFYYIDYAEIENDTGYTSENLLTPFVDQADHHSPEGMEKPIPIGIYVTGNEDFRNNYIFNNTDQEAVFGLAYYAEYPDYALQFLDYMSGRVE